MSQGETHEAVTTRQLRFTILKTKECHTSKNCLYLLLAHRVLSSAIACGWLLQYSE